MRYFLLLFCFWTILDSSTFSLFHSCQVFHDLVCRLTVLLPQTFFNLTTLFSYPVVFCPFHAPLYVVVHFLVFFRSFRFKSFLPQFSPFVAQIENFCSDPGFFLLTMFAKNLTGCFSHCCVEGGDHWICVCIFVAHNGEKCKPPAYHSLEGFQHVGMLGSFSFSRSNSSLVCWFCCCCCCFDDDAWDRSSGLISNVHPVSHPELERRHLLQIYSQEVRAQRRTRPQSVWIMPLAKTGRKREQQLHWSARATRDSMLWRTVQRERPPVRLVRQ